MPLGLRPVSLAAHTWVVAYDITDDGVRARVADALSGYGFRVLFSVFECRLDAAELRSLRGRVQALIDPQHDRVRWYPLCRRCVAQVSWQGQELVDRVTRNPDYVV